MKDPAGSCSPLWEAVKDPVTLFWVLPVRPYRKKQSLIFFNDFFAILGLSRRPLAADWISAWKSLPGRLL